MKFTVSIKLRGPTGKILTVPSQKPLEFPNLVTAVKESLKDLPEPQLGISVVGISIDELEEEDK